MSDSIIRKVLKPGVGRRIFSLFLFAAVVPLIATALLAYHELHRGLEIEAAKALKNSAKEYGVAIFSRLEQASEKADEVARLVERGSVAAVLEFDYLQSNFDSIWIVGDDGLPASIVVKSVAGMSRAKLDGNDLRNGGAQLYLTHDNEMILLRSFAQDNGRVSVLAFQLLAEKVWGSRDNLPFNTEYCVFSEAGESLYCTAEIDPSIHAALLAVAGDNRGSIFSNWVQRGEAHYASLWQLFLKGAFGAQALDIVAIQPQAFAMESGAVSRNVLAPAIVLVVVLVILLTMNVVDHSLGPLRKLTLAAQQVAGGKLKSRVDLRTGDEFQRLGDAFNSMTDQIDYQISALEAMSGIDALILTGTRLEEVSEHVATHLVSLTGCKSAAVIANDTDAPAVGTMISLHNGKYIQERIELPSDVEAGWYLPRQVALADIDAKTATYADRFESFGQAYVVLLPVKHHDSLKGILLLGFDSQFDMVSTSLQRCVDIAGRFAVALASVEREEALYQQAHFDVLTGLPNRQLLKDRLDQSLATARREEQSGAVLFLDLDRFKEVNDVFGHSIGDIVLKQASERIKAVVREQDTVARLGGDEFVVLLPNVRDTSVVRNTAKRLLDKLREAFTVAGADHYLSASIGITLFPSDGVTVETLLKNADAAMYRAKDSGRGRFEFFSKQLNAESRRKIDLERDLRVAQQRGELEVYYQPQIDILTGGISGAEALLRWTHPQLGPVSPAEFIPLAEDTELIVEIGASVIETVCLDLAEILDMRLHPGSTSVNVSGRQLADTSFARAVMDPIRRHGINPGYIQLEITETVVAENRDRAIAILEELRKDGVRVAIDDFGTGYSSLSYLQQLPFDVIKIDKSFVDEIGASDASNNICRTIITMAKLLGKKSIAEGVESHSQLEFLRHNGCNFVQGYIYSKPLPKAEFIAFVRQQDFHTQRRKALEIL